MPSPGCLMHCKMELSKFFLFSSFLNCSERSQYATTLVKLETYSSSLMLPFLLPPTFTSPAVTDCIHLYMFPVCTPPVLLQSLSTVNSHNSSHNYCNCFLIGFLATIPAPSTLSPVPKKGIN